MKDGDSPQYWPGLFAEQTWLEAEHGGFHVSGSAAGRWSMVQRMRPADPLSCHPAGRSAYIGLLRVMSEPYQDSA